MRFALLPVLALAACTPANQPSGGEEDGRTVLFNPNATSPMNSAPDRVSMQELATMVGSQCGEATQSTFLGQRAGTWYYAMQCQTQRFLVGVAKDSPPEVQPCAAAQAAGKSCDKPWPAG